MIKIAAISDMHGMLEGLDVSGYDICVIAGDFTRQTGFGKWQTKDQRNWIYDKFRKWTGRFSDTIFVVVAGNHDLCLDETVTSKYPGTNWHIDWPDNVKYLCDSQAVVNGIKFYGVPWVPVINGQWAFEADSRTLRHKFADIPKNVDILISHSPPNLPGYFGDVSLEYGKDSRKFGSVELADALFDKKPQYVICGHIHSGSHEPFKFWNTVVVNVSRVDESYCVRYSPFTFEI